MVHINSQAFSSPETLLSGLLDARIRLYPLKFPFSPGDLNLIGIHFELEWERGLSRFELTSVNQSQG